MKAPKLAHQKVQLDNLKIVIEEPSRNNARTFPLMDIIAIYSKAELTALFKGKLDGDSWCWLKGDGGYNESGWITWLEIAYSQIVEA